MSKINFPILETNSNQEDVLVYVKIHANDSFYFFFKFENSIFFSIVVQVKYNNINLSKKKKNKYNNIILYV